MNTSQKRFTRIFAMLLALVMAAGTFSGCQKNDREPLGTELELLAEETIAPPAAEETEPETSLPEVTTEPTVSTEPTEAEDASTEPTEAKDKPHIHSYTSTVVAPTTTTEGYTLHTCKICGQSYKDHYKNKLTSGGSGSTGSGSTGNSGNSGSTGSSGSSGNGSSSGNSGGSTHTHSYTTSVTQPTCTKKGYTTYTCKTCGYSYKANEKPALGHDWEHKELGTEGWYAWQAAYGTQHALNRRVCERCGHEEFQDCGLAHDPGKLIEVVKPTCTEEGYELHECLGFVGNDQGWPQCDYNHKTNIVPALGHDWGDWVVTTQPTQDSEGVETRTCSRCSEKETRKLDKLTPSETEPADPKPTDPEPTDPEPTEPETTEPKPTEPGIDTSNSVIVTSEALAVINKYRAENGLAPYSAGGGEECAKIRAAELQISFSHTRPDGNICAGLLSQYGFWSECIAWGASSAQGAVDMWMASNDGHREIMLDPSYTYATIARNGDKWVFMAG